MLNSHYCRYIYVYFLLGFLCAYLLRRTISNVTYEYQRYISEVIIIYRNLNETESKVKYCKIYHKNRQEFYIN